MNYMYNCVRIIIVSKYIYVKIYMYLSLSLSPSPSLNQSMEEEGVGWPFIYRLE